MGLLDLLYPPRCLHCKASLEKHAQLCTGCLSLLTLLPKEGRCTKCCAEIGARSGVCLSCRTLSHPYRSLNACFDPHGPAHTLLKAFLTSNNFHLAKDIAAFFVIQLDNLKLPFQLITMIPNHLRNPHYAIGKEISKMLGLPFKPLLKRHWTPDPTISLKKKCNIINKQVLFIDISIKKDLELIRAAAFALDSGLPEHLYGVTFCAI